MGVVGVGLFLMPEFIHPTTGLPPSATSGYNFYDWSTAINGQHCAWDVGLQGVAIKNIKAGVVGWEGWHYQLGWHVYLTCADGMRILYAHMAARALVRVGLNVSQGSVIGYVGATGTVTGAHLHFAMSYKSVAEAASKVHQYGGPLSAVKWRSDHMLAYVDPAIFIGKSVPQEDDMDTIIIITTKGGPAQYLYSPVDDKAQHLSYPGLLAINAAEGQGKIKVARVELTDAEITGIGKILT